MSDTLISIDGTKNEFIQNIVIITTHTRHGKRISVCEVIIPAGTSYKRIKKHDAISLRTISDRGLPLIENLTWIEVRTLDKIGFDITKDSETIIFEIEEEKINLDDLEKLYNLIKNSTKTDS